MSKVFKEIKDKTIKELGGDALKLRQEISKAKLELKVNPPKNTNLSFVRRKRLAVILTVMNQTKI